MARPPAGQQMLDRCNAVRHDKMHGEPLAEGPQGAGTT